MPFQNLRVNSEFFILHRDGTPYIEVGSVSGVSNPVPEFMQQPLPYGQPPKMVVDITIKVGEQTVTFQKYLPCLILLMQIFQGEVIW